MKKTETKRGIIVVAFVHLIKMIKKAFFFVSRSLSLPTSAISTGRGGMPNYFGANRQRDAMLSIEQALFETKGNKE